MRFPLPLDYLESREHSKGRRLSASALPAEVRTLAVSSEQAPAAVERKDGSEDATPAGFRTLDIPTDAYGAAILCFARDFPLLAKRFSAGLDCLVDDDGECENVIWSCINNLTIFFINLMLQTSILAYVNSFVISPDKAKVQNLFADFHNSVFDQDGRLVEQLWEDYDGKRDICSLAVWNRPFFYNIIFCWILSVLIEIKKSEELLVNLWNVPICEDMSKQLLRLGDSLYVVAFTRLIRNSVVILVAIPKLGISLVLLWLGCEWLCTTANFESLVMNTVAMAFIVSLDEVLFDSILPAHQRLEVENIDFLLKTEDASSKGAVDDRVSILRKNYQFRKALLYFLLSCIFLIVYTEYMQDVLPADITAITGLCEDHINQGYPPCHGWTWYLQGIASAREHECFPYRAAPAADFNDVNFGPL